MLVLVLIFIVVALAAVVVYIVYVAPRISVMNRAENFFRQKMVPEAILEYRKILDHRPDNTPARYRLAEIYLQTGDVDQAVRELEAIVQSGRYSYEVDRLDVQKKLALAYLSRDEKEDAFQLLLEILKSYPGDADALYHTAFIALGQEFFEMAQRLFERLARRRTRDFDIYFGAGIASYQSQHTPEAIGYFKEALAIDSHSDVANLAMAFAQQRKRDYKTGINFVTMIVDNSTDATALFVARRLMGVLLVQVKRAADGVKVLEELLAHARANEMTEEIALILYDLGFAAIRAELTDMAYEYWNQLYQHNRNFRDIQNLVTGLRREMDADIRSGGTAVESSVADLSDDWLENAFPQNFLWNICGLKSDQKIDLKKVTITTRMAVSGKEETPGAAAPAAPLSGDAVEALSRFMNLDSENFRIIANRVVSRLGYRVDEIMTTYRETDGVDFMAVPTGEKARILVSVRRWKSNIGEIPLRNFAQSVNDMKAREGIFITATELTDTAESALPRIGRVRVVKPDELGELLNGLL